jgi:D-arabinose 1-dehydrogenase-like Zn-dependent alcohol dehydrogenase
MGSSGTPPRVVGAGLVPPRQGKIAPLVHQVFPLAEAREAMATMERREHFGKIVLKPAA